MAEFGEQLRKAREHNGITQQTLAERIFVTRQTISRYETGERYPDIVILKKISSVLGVTVDYLLGDEDMTKIVEKSPIIDKPFFHNVSIALYTLIAVAYVVFVINQLPGSDIVLEAVGNGGVYLYSLFVLQLFSMCLFLYGLFCALFGKMNSGKTGIIMAIFLILEGSKTVQYFLYDIHPILFLIVGIYLFGAVCAILFFFRKSDSVLSIAGALAVSCFGIYRQIYTQYCLLMYADHMYSWINSLVAFLTVTIYLLFIYQTAVLKIKRNQARIV